MYEKFKLWLASIFGYNVVSEQDIVQERYEQLSRKLFHAKTLNDLMIAQQELKTLKNYVERIGDPYWARGRMQALNRYWHKRYALWKSRG